MKLGKAAALVLLVPLIIPAAFAQTDLIEPLSWVFGPFVNLFDQSGSLSAGTLVAITRFVIWLVIFAVIYSVLKNVSGLKWITNSIAMVLAFSFATISAIFTPAIWILQIGSTWAQIAALAMLGPIMLVLLWHAWKKRDVPALSAAELFVALALLEYFNVLFSIEYPPGNFISVEGIGRAPGVLSVVCQTAIVVVSIAFIIQLIRAIMALMPKGETVKSEGNLGDTFKKMFTPSPANPRTGSSATSAPGGASPGSLTAASPQAMAREKERTIARDIKDFQRLRELYDKKIRELGPMLSGLQHGPVLHDPAQMKQVANYVQGMNRQLLPLLLRFIKDMEQTERAEDYRIYQVLAREHGGQLGPQQQAHMQNFVKRFKQHLENLATLMGKQDELAVQIHKGHTDLRVPFVNALLGEATLYNEVRHEGDRLVLELQAEHDIEKRGTLQRMTSRPRIVELTMPDARFDRFYKILQDVFGEDELDDKEVLEAALHASYDPLGVHGTSHVLAVEMATENGLDYIGGLFFDSIMTTGYYADGRLYRSANAHPFLFGVVWWVFLRPDVPADIRRQAADLMNQTMLVRLKHQANLRGVQQGEHGAKGIFGEVSDPTKMSPDMRKEDISNPLARLLFFSSMGARPVLKDYYQLLTFDEEMFKQELEQLQQLYPGRDVLREVQEGKHLVEVKERVLAAEKDVLKHTSLHLVYKPLSQDWFEHGIPAEELRMVLWGFVAIANAWPHYLIPYLESYRRMEEAVARGGAYFGTKQHTMRSIIGNSQQLHQLHRQIKQERGIGHQAAGAAHDAATEAHHA